jgi:murein DD-endopeptidase MepM/ murein hydrolase activator NlpD
MRERMAVFGFPHMTYFVKATMMLLGSLLLLTACAQASPQNPGHIPLATSTASTMAENSILTPLSATLTPDVRVNRLYVPAVSGSDPDQPTSPLSPPLMSSITSDEVVASSPFEICSPLLSIPLEELAQVVSAPYSPPPTGSDERHQGVDFAYYHRGGRLSILGDGVQSVLAGRVAGLVIDRYPYGNTLIVETPASELPGALRETLDLVTGESLYLLYAHMETPPNFQMGAWVEVCQLLDTVGKSGNAGVAHLHLEARLGPADSRFTSMAYYIESASDEERQAYRLWRTSGVYRSFDPLLLFDFDNMGAP